MRRLKVEEVEMVEGVEIGERVERVRLHMIQHTEA